MRVVRGAKPRRTDRRAGNSSADSSISVTIYIDGEMSCWVPTAYTYLYRNDVGITSE